MGAEKTKLVGVLLLNLGGPDSLDAVRPFLYNLFSDREIIKLGPAFMQKPIAWFISTTRSSKSRQMYSLIGGKSPILDITTAQAEALEKALNQSSETRFQGSEVKFKVYIGMRYWHPYVDVATKQITHDGIESLIVLSLYPHYSKTTTGSSISEFERCYHRRDIEIKFIKQWYEYEPYIEALSDLIYGGIDEFRRSDFAILYSAHNLPTSFINEGDPYLDHIKATINAVNERLSGSSYNLSDIKWELAFQSKSGPVEWLEPSTEETIIKLSNEGYKNIFIVPISFVSDHIETLYEIDILFKRVAEDHGIKLKRCQALNTHNKFIDALKELVFSKCELGS